MKKASFHYRPSNTLDVEERLEDAALLNAMKTAFGDGIGIIDPRNTPHENALVFGRPRHFETYRGPAVRRDYWNDRGFRAGISREFHVTDLEGAAAIVKDLHGRGKDAFLKGVELKTFTGKAPIGQDLHGVLGDMVWSFMDKPGSLMVQEFLPMRDERRFAIIDRVIVSVSPVAHHLTPLDRGRYLEAGRRVEDMHFANPGQRASRHDPAQAQAMRDFVEQVVKRSEFDHMILDVAMTDRGIEVIEYNPMVPGQFGVFAMDVQAIANASIALLPDDLAIEVLRRREASDPWSAVAPAEPEPETEAPDTAFALWQRDVEADLETPFLDGP